jgi:hypothetical protein
VALVELESVLKRLRAWAQDHSAQVEEGIIELGESFPQLTVVGFGPDDIALFLTLAGLLRPTVVALNAPPLNEEDLRLANALAADLTDPEERAHFKKVVTAARAYLGKVHEINAAAFAPGVERAVVFRSATDWGAELFSLAARFDG